MKKRSLFLLSMVSFSSILFTLGTLEADASEVSLDPEARNKINSELSVMAYDFSQFGFNEWINKPGENP